MDQFLQSKKNVIYIDENNSDNEVENTEEDVKKGRKNIRKVPTVLFIFLLHCQLCI